MVIMPFFLVHQGYAQEPDSTPPEKQRKFSIGLDYTYMSTSLNLTGMSFQSIWDGQDLGTEILPLDEIDSVNAFVDYSNRFQGLHLEVGMIFLSKPASRWKVEGKVLIGLVKRKYNVYNQSTDMTDMQITSEAITPGFGYTMNIGYTFNSFWGVRAVPYIFYSWGKSNKVEDNVHPVVPGMTECRSNKSNYLYARFNLMATLTVKNFTVFAGPGFYLLRIWNNYEILREDPIAGTMYEDYIESRLFSPSFIDATVALEWQFVSWMSVNLTGAAGNDLMIRAGIRYHL